MKFNKAGKQQQEIVVQIQLNLAYAKNDFFGNAGLLRRQGSLQISIEHLEQIVLASLVNLFGDKAFEALATNLKLLVFWLGAFVGNCCVLIDIGHKLVEAQEEVVLAVAADWNLDVETKHFEVKL